MKKGIVGTVIALVVLIAAGALYWFVFRKDLSNQIIMPYIAHQKPRIDPHVQSSVPIADKLDEPLFDGLFNVSANASGVTYEDGLGEYLGIDAAGIVSLRLKPNHKWHASYTVTMDKKKIAITSAQQIQFTAADLKFTLRRIQKLGSLSPDNILVAQAIPDFDFQGPDAEGIVRFQFRGDRTWVESDIKEVLSFKILPSTADMDAAQYTNGTGPFMYAGEYEDVMYFKKMPDGSPAKIDNLILKPFIDNSTYTTELKNRNINMLLSTPFGSMSPILGDTGKFFCKSSIATTFFGILFNTERLSVEKRLAVRKLINNRAVMDRFFKVGTPQQRHIANYKGAPDNYEEYLNYSVFPSTSYYVEEEIVTPLKNDTLGDIAALTDTIRIKASLNYDYREELADLIAILNDPSISKGKIKVEAVAGDEIAKGNYDAVLVPFTGYRSNFLFDLYTVFLREPDLGANRINLVTAPGADGKLAADPRSFTSAKNFFRIDLASGSADAASYSELLNYIYGFMSTSEIGDKQAYAQRIDMIDQQMALGAWLFSLPSLAYVSTQFDPASIDMYGTASQLSTIEKWQEKKKK